MKFTNDFSEFKPWSGAEDTFYKIDRAGMLDDLEQYLEEIFCDEIPSATQINDLLWFEGEEVLKALGLVEEPELPEEVDIYVHTIENLIDEDQYTEEEFTTAMTDYLSDEYGFCLNGYDYNIHHGIVHVYNIDWDTETEGS